MTLVEAFLRDIANNPEDSSTVLIFADWLEDQGDPRAELLRERIDPESRYILLESLERNGEFEIQCVLDTVTQEKVKLHRLQHPMNSSWFSSLCKLWRETTIAASCRHPCLLPLLSMNLVNGNYFFTQPCVEGKSLPEVITEEQFRGSETGRFSLDRRILVFLKIAHVLQQVHEKGFLHRELGPHAVLLEPDFESVYLIGWQYSSIPEMRTTASMETLMTARVACLAPEIIQFGPDPGFASSADLYGLGVILYFLLTSTMPHSGDNTLGLMMSIIEGEPARPREIAPEIPVELDAICMRCLQQDANARYPTVGALIEDLHQYLAGEWEFPEEPGTLKKLFQWCRSFLPGGKA